MSEAVLTEKQQELYDLMSDVSEEHWCAGWMSGLEFDLWERAKGDGSLPYGLGQIDPVLLQKLRELSEEIGGWIHMDEAGEVFFVPLEDWIDMAEWVGPFKTDEMIEVSDA